MSNVANIVSSSSALIASAPQDADTAPGLITETNQQVPKEANRIDHPVIELVTDADRLIPHSLAGFLPPLDGVRLEALKQSLANEGQRQPIMADESGTVWDGRARLQALTELQKPIHVIRVSSSEGKQIALAGLRHRDMTVLDEAKLIAWIEQHEVESVEGMKSRESVSEWLKTKLGWVRRVSPVTVQKYKTLADRLGTATQKQLAAVTMSATVTAALGVFPKPPRMSASPTRAIHGKLKGLSKALDALKGDALNAKMKVLKTAVKAAIDSLKPVAAPKAATKKQKPGKKANRKRKAGRSGRTKVA